MRNFKDSDGNQWGIRVDRAMLRTVKQETGVLLTDLWLEDMALLQQICSDTILASDIIWVCCRDQAKRREMDQAAFESLTEGDHFESAVHALIEAVTDFFPSSQQKTLFKLLELGEKQTEAQQNLMQEALNQKIREMEKKSTSSNSTTSSPESVESTPTPERSENSPAWPKRSKPMTTTLP